jgi:hypothetical protein
MSKIEDDLESTFKFIKKLSITKPSKPNNLILVMLIMLGVISMLTFSRVRVNTVNLKLKDCVFADNYNTDQCKRLRDNIGN